MKRNHIIKSIHYRQVILTVTVSFVILSVCTTIFFGYHSIKDDFYQYIASTQNMLLKQTALKIEDTISTAEIISNMYYYNPAIDTIIHTNSKYLDETTKYSYYIKMKGIDEQLETALINSNLPYKCIMISDNGFTYNSTARISDYDFGQYSTPEWDLQLKDSNGNIVLMTPYKDTASNASWYWSFTRILKNNATYKPAGRLFINIKERTIYDFYKNLSDTQNDVFVLDSSQTIISSNRTNVIGTAYPNFDTVSNITAGEIQNIDGIKCLVLTFPVEHTELLIVEHIPLSSVLTPFETAAFRILIYCIAITVILIIIAGFLTSKAVLPFNRLYASLSQFGSGDLNVTFTPSHIEEFQQINSICNITVKKIKQLIEEIQEKEEQKRMAEIQALQSQIRPHFLDNTLFTVKCMVDMNKTESASAMLKHLCALLKYIQHNQEILTTVSDEIEELRQYIAIMSYRYPDSFDIDILVEPRAMQYKILRHILQPLVENSIFHGIRPDGVMNHITLSIRITEDAMLISVSDTGRGIDPDKLSTIFLPPEHEKWVGHRTQHEHVGLFNVKERLLLYFHTPDPIVVTSVPYTKTTFTVTHPLLIGEEEKNAENINR